MELENIDIFVGLCDWLAEESSINVLPIIQYILRCNLLDPRIPVTSYGGRGHRYIRWIVWLACGREFDKCVTNHSIHIAMQLIRSQNTLETYNEIIPVGTELVWPVKIPVLQDVYYEDKLFKNINHMPEVMYCDLNWQPHHDVRICMHWVYL